MLSVEIRMTVKKQFFNIHQEVVLVGLPEVEQAVDLEGVQEVATAAVAPQVLKFSHLTSMSRKNYRD